MYMCMYAMYVGYVYAEGKYVMSVRKIFLLFYYFLLRCIGNEILKTD